MHHLINTLSGSSIYICLRPCCCCSRFLSGQVPRLHAVLVKKLDARCMTLPMQLSQAKLAAQSARQQALHLLRLAVGGDALAAEYLLLQLLARCWSYLLPNTHTCCIQGLGNCH